MEDDTCDGDVEVQEDEDDCSHGEGEVDEDGSHAVVPVFVVPEDNLAIHEFQPGIVFIVLGFSQVHVSYELTSDLCTWSGVHM